MQIGVFHPGTQHSWQTALALQQLGRLEWYATSIFYQPDLWPYRLERLLPGRLGDRLHREFSRFSQPALDPRLVRTSGMAEWAERIAARAGLHRMAQQIDRLGNRRFVGKLAQQLHSDRAFALWGYNGSSRSSFELARQLGRPTILDRTIGDPRSYNVAMAALQDRYGEWFLETERAILAAAIADDQAEYELADAIVVGSEYAAATIREHGGVQVAAKVRVLPYCYDEALFGTQPPPQEVSRDGPLRFLFIGLANPRKGFHHLLEAIARIPRSAAELTIVGDLRVPRQVFARYADRVNYIPTVPRSAIPQIMADHHVLVFPSYFEGSALSLIEALASGLAVIQTRASGNGATPDCGIVLDHPDTDALHGAMMAVIDARDKLDSWRHAAQSEAAKYTFANYRSNIAALLSDLGLDAAPTVAGNA